MDLVTLSIERFALKLACESHLKWETFLPNLGMLLVLELFAMYATDGRTKATFIAPSAFPTAAGA